MQIIVTQGIFVKKDVLGGPAGLRKNGNNLDKLVNKRLDFSTGSWYICINFFLSGEKLPEISQRKGVRGSGNKE
jgi:hypothetical protein